MYFRSHKNQTKKRSESGGQNDQKPERAQSIKKANTKGNCYK